MSGNSNHRQLETPSAVAKPDSQNANDHLAQPNTAPNNLNAAPNPSNDNVLHHPAPTSTTPQTHALLLLSDSALPLGSFAFSSGLESYLAHHKKPLTPTHSFHHFLHLSVATLASTSLPYLLAAHRDPDRLPALDDALDASTPCAVARRASLAQGRALLTVWDRALRPAACDGDGRATTTLVAFAALLKAAGAGADSAGLGGANGHFAPLWGLVCAAMGIPISQMAYVFLLNHAKAVLSAGVRACVIGPYQAQGVLAGGELRERIEGCVRREWETGVEDAGQVVPVMDLWVGRHELLYSRMFNS